jgi:hypothetical protein
MMAGVVVTSDLRMGITDEDVLRRHTAAIVAERPDLAALAGDIGEGLERFRACLGIFQGLPSEVAVLAREGEPLAVHVINSEYGDPASITFEYP